MHKVFIDGQAGTTGLQLQSLLEARDDIRLLQIDEADRKDLTRKTSLLREADLVILCLPDDAARDTVDLTSGLPLKVLDASTAHRVNPAWTYGLPELHPGQRERIRQARLVSNPGCYPTGFLLAIAPLVAAGLLPATTRLTINAVSGYSGGGRQLIERYEQKGRSGTAGTSWAVRPYGLHLTHKHVPEMRYHAGLTEAPLFVPSVGDYRQGMLVQIPLFCRDFAGDSLALRIHDAWSACYRNEPCVKVHAINPEDQLEAGFLDPELNNGTNSIELFVFATEQHAALIARLDNLGKGAAGAAVQNMNLMLGCDEFSGIELR